jgi:hypothetical protein
MNVQPDPMLFDAGAKDRSFERVPLMIKLACLAAGRRKHWTADTRGETGSC